MILNCGGIEVRKLPVLSSSFPADATVEMSSSASATFSVVIEEEGKPSAYSYQWYENGSPVSGATSESYTAYGLSTAGTRTVYCEVSNKAGTVKSRVATLEVTSKPLYLWNSGAVSGYSWNNASGANISHYVYKPSDYGAQNTTTTKCTPSVDVTKYNVLHVFATSVSRTAAVFCGSTVFSVKAGENTYNISGITGSQIIKFEDSIMYDADFDEKGCTVSKVWLTE